MQVQSVAVVGAGFMGSGIAESAARAGCQVVVHEPERAPLARSRERVERSVEKGVRAGKLDEAGGAALLERLTWSADLDELAGAEVVVEAVIEDPKVKGALFQRLDRALPGARILATNTSSIPIAEVASWTARRDRVCGLHFFSPVPVMKLVEVVRGIDTSDDVLREAEAFALQLGKQPIRTKDRSGFIVNMLLVPYLMSGIRMYEDGFATREDIDQGMKLGCGHPMGPLELADFIGLDVMYAIGQSLYEEFKRPDFAPPPLLKRMVVSGHFGRKSGRGFYEYEDVPAARAVAA